MNFHRGEMCANLQLCIILIEANVLRYLEYGFFSQIGFKGDSFRSDGAKRIAFLVRESHHSQC